jgi:hypothetical protein
MVPRWIFAVFVALLTVGCLLGLIATLAVHVASHLHVQILREQWEALAYGLFPTWLLTILVTISERPPSYRFWEFLLRGSPRWMHQVFGWLFAYAAINMVLIVAALVVGGMRQLGPEWEAAVEAWGITGHLLVFYWIAFVVAYAKLVRLTHPPPRCPNGHAVAADHRYCTKCGAMTEGFFEYDDSVSD